MQDFPRVLFITPVAFNPYTGGGATFSSLFSGWPKDRLATIHNDADPTTSDVCENYYMLGSAELDFIEPFGWLRRRRRSAPQAVSAASDFTPRSPPGTIDRIRNYLLRDSIPERSRLTPELHRWIDDFRPDVIYTILGSNGMMALIEKVRAAFHLPLVVHIMDDWSSSAHRSGVFAPLERFKMNRWLAHFFKIAETCLGISSAMQAAYSKRYSRPFTAIQFTLDTERWAATAKRDLVCAQQPEFLYVGSIFADAQLQSLIDCVKAIAELNGEGFPATLRIVTQARTITRYRQLLDLHPMIKLEPSQFDDPTFFAMLARADALLLPVNFDSHSVSLMRYSMPTKVPSYLVSGTPCMVYGSTETAQVQYAQDAHWGHVVAERSLPGLKAGLRRIIEDMPLRHALSAAARTVSLNHDEKRVRPVFQNVLRQAAQAHKTLR